MTTNSVFALKIRIKTSEVLLAKPKASGAGALGSKGRSFRRRWSKVRASWVEALGNVNENFIILNCFLTWFTKGGILYKG